MFFGETVRRKTVNQEKVHRLEHLTGHLAETLMSAAFCVEEIRGAVRAVIHDSTVGRNPAAGRNGKVRPATVRPILSESTLSVVWKGRSVYLGNTLGYRLLGRLARSPNQFVTHLDLLQEVWENEELATGTIRSVVRHLRRRLRDGGMGGLAKAIKGHNGRYILEL